MTKERLYLFDTTLRDGAQTNGVDFSLEDKIAVAGMLDGLGVDYVEGGYPGANPTDNAFFEEKRTTRAGFTAFGMTKRPGVSLSNDPGLRALLDANADAICFVAKTWDYHVRVALQTTEEENLDGIRQSVAAAREAGKEVLLDCEHFFDGYKANPAYALACAKAAYDAGARWVVLCDTNGGTHARGGRGDRRARSRKIVPGDHLGIHAHNDTEQAVANSLAAVRAGARQIQGTLNGIGERCGNANLTSLIPTLMLKPAYAERFEIGVGEAGLAGLTAAGPPLRRTGQPRAEPPGALCRRQRLRHQGRHPCLGDRQGPASTYEHVPPETVGNRRHVLVSDQAGKANLLAELAAHGPRGRQGRPAPRLAAPRGQGARGDRLCLRGRRRLLRASGAARCSAPCRISSTSRAFTSPSSAATTRSASWSRSRRRW